LTDTRNSLPDPRRYGAGDHPLLRLAGDDLSRELEMILREGREAEITAAMRAAPSRAARTGLWQAVCDAAHRGGNDSDPAVVARIFALPLVIITGSSRPASLPGVVPDIAAITSLFEQHAALGKTKNFGIGNALCSFETLDGVTPSEVHAWSAAAGGARRELEPAAIEIAAPGEQVHLRFLAGAAITAASEPSFVETAANIGAWGMPLTRALGAQLNQPGIEVLPLARPPLDLLRAAHAGRVAQLETAFNLFASNAVRRFRASTGDPVAVLAAHDDGELRVGLSSPFDETLEGFRWPLHPIDDIEAIVTAMLALFAECRVNDIRCVGRVLPALGAQGQVRYPTVRDVDEPTSGLQPH
jgi:hypothetical protein